MHTHKSSKNRALSDWQGQQRTQEFSKWKAPHGAQIKELLKFLGCRFKCSSGSLKVLRHKTPSSNALKAQGTTWTTVCPLHPKGSWHPSSCNEQGKPSPQGEENANLTGRPAQPSHTYQKSLQLIIFFSQRRVSTIHRTLKSCLSTPPRPQPGPPSPGSAPHTLPHFTVAVSDLNPHLAST